MLRFLAGSLIALMAASAADAQTISGATCVGNLLPLPQIYFGSGSSAVGPAEVSVVKSWALQMVSDRQCPLTLVFISGFDDAVRTPEASRLLSYRRALMVSSILEGGGVPKEKLIIMAMGQEDVIGPAPSGIQDATWRRVDIGFGVHPTG